MAKKGITTSWCCPLVLAVLAGAFLALSGCTATYTSAAPPPPPPQYYEPPPPDYEYFDELSYYGSWVEIHPFGLVWQPFVVAGWRPYHHGHWEWTDWGWMWIGYEPFSWATYHYGYWHYDPGWGWIWIPGYEWSPVRVQWIWFDDYVCWTPLPPPGYVIADPWVAHRPGLWVTVHFKHFYSHDINRYSVEFPRSARKWKSVRSVRDKPPTVDIVEKHVRRPVRRVPIEVKNVKAGKREYKRVVLPPAYREQVEGYKQKAEKKVLKPEVKKRVSESRPPAYKSGEKERTKKAVTPTQKTPQKKQKAQAPDPAKTKKQTSKPAKTKKKSSKKKG